MFLAATIYMGVVRLPSIAAYWAADKTLPDHFFTKDISLWRYQMLWRCLHITDVVNDVEEAEDPELHDGDEDDGNFHFAQPEDNRWFNKVGPLLDHVREVLKTLMVPGSKLSIDEMMLRFFGRSAQTFRMKNKPIKEGYKVMALACAFTGYVYAITPDGRLGSQGEVTARDSGKIVSMVTHLTDQLPPPHQHKYTLAMDNYFTTPQTMKALREDDIGAFGTARARRGWPPKEITSVNSLTFNDCHYTTDDFGTRVYRWVDNNVVNFVSTIHHEEVSVKVNRKKPRITAVNRNNVEKVWGDDHVKEIEIPEFIDDYNHCMNAVDRADQLIASLSMKHKCRRTWMPFLLYLLNIFRTNSYIVHRELKGGMTHMEFTLGLVRALHSRRNDVRVTRKRAREDETLDRPIVHTRLRNNVDPLPEARLRDPDRHIPSMYEWRKRCFYCRYKAAIARKNKNKPGKINICSRGCAVCGDVALCRSCFAAYHSKEV